MDHVYKVWNRNQGDNDSLFPSISSDGRYVAFFSYATNLVAGDTNGSHDAFITTLGAAEAVVTRTVPTLNEWGDDYLYVVRWNYLDLLS